MRFLVKLGTRRYLRAEDEGADELWNDVMGALVLQRAVQGE